MNIKTLRWVAAAAVLGAVFLRPAAGDNTGLEFIISATAVLLMAQAGIKGRYAIAGALTFIAVLFNPVLPVTLLSMQFAWLYLSALVVFGSLLALLKVFLRPRLSMPSITGRTPGSESL